MLTHFRLTVYTLLFVVLVSASGLAVDRTQSHSSSDSLSVARLLKAAKKQATIVQTDAADLSTFARGTGNWQEAKERAISHNLDKAQEIGRELLERVQLASPRQNVVIDQILPLLRELRANVRAMLEHVRANPAEVHSNSCIEYLSGHEEIVRRLTSKIDRSVDSLASNSAKE